MLTYSNSDLLGNTFLQLTVLTLYGNTVDYVRFTYKKGIMLFLQYTNRKMFTSCDFEKRVGFLLRKGL